MKCQQLLSMPCTPASCWILEAASLNVCKGQPGFRDGILAGLCTTVSCIVLEAQAVEQHLQFPHASSTFFPVYVPFPESTIMHARVDHSLSISGQQLAPASTPVITGLCIPTDTYDEHCCRSI